MICLREYHKKGSSFLKKRSKRLLRRCRGSFLQSAPQDIKVFWFFFSKKNCFFLLLACPAKWHTNAGARVPALPVSQWSPFWHTPLALRVAFARTFQKIPEMTSLQSVGAVGGPAARRLQKHQHSVRRQGHFIPAQGPAHRGAWRNLYPHDRWARLPIHGICGT